MSGATRICIIKYNINTQARTQTVKIIDNDYVPTVGVGTVELLKEVFTATKLPAKWAIKSVIGIDPNVWLFNGPSTLGKAYISNGSAGQGATYDQSVTSNLLLISPLIDTKGISNVAVSFDWQAGGETDQVDNTKLFDYGEFVYSLDGATYNSLAFFAGTAAGANVRSGTYNAAIPALDNTQFNIAWRWYNDALVGTAFSFTIDNVLVKGKPASVESDVTHFDSENVKAGNQVYFLSNQDGGVIGMIENASSDLGCVTLTVDQAGNNSNFTNIAASHTGKVLKLEADAPNAATATYDITLFFTNAETSGFANASALKVIKVNSNLINDAKDTPSPNYTVNGGLLTAFTTQQYSTYKGTHTGFGTFALQSQERLSNQEFNTSAFKIYPTLVTNDKVITIFSSGTAVNQVEIYTINGVLTNSLKLDNLNTAKIPVNKLATGMYFLTINGNKSDTFKFIIK